jgi:two-component system, response regulator, stage 0 sporulation protein F
MRTEHARRRKLPVILVAEDDVDLRTTIATVLSADGYRVVGVRDGVEALQYLEFSFKHPDSVRPPDLVISDERMPRCSGMRVLEHLDRDGYEVPRILITGFGAKATHEEAKRLGASFTFDKPFELDDLRTAVRNLLR